MLQKFHFFDAKRENPKIDLLSGKKGDSYSSHALKAIFIVTSICKCLANVF